jgi:hypothetical protein
MVKTSRVEFHGYSDCLRLENETVRVTLGHQCGGRVLEYSLDGENSLALDPGQAGWMPGPGKPEIDPWGGRFDIGREKVIAPHPTLWLGSWTAEPVAEGVARLTSLPDLTTGAQLVREFELDPHSSHLRCTQTIVNTAAQDRAWYHWSRTLARGGGICVIPLTPPSRFPAGYVMYGDGWTLDYKPQDPNIRIRDGFLEIFGAPANPKLCIDSYAGWFAYLQTSGMLFAKRFRTYPERAYTDIVAAPLSIWYRDESLCELEPIGPEERLAPGQSASFTEDWWLLPYEFPERRDALNLNDVARLVQTETQASGL